MSDLRAHGEDSIFQEFRGLFIGLGIGLVVIVLIALGVFFWASRNNTDFAEGENISIVRDYNPKVGNPDANVVVTYFTDFQCPACRAQHEPLAQVKDQYSDRVQFVYKQYPVPALHPYAQPAAESALAVYEVAPDKYLEFVDLIFTNQSQLSVESLDNWANGLGIDMTRYNEVKRDPLTEDKIQQDKDDVEDLNLPASNAVPSVEAKPAGRAVGTPTFVVYKDGQVYDWWTGTLSQVEISNLLNEALAE